MYRQASGASANSLGMQALLFLGFIVAPIATSGATYVTAQPSPTPMSSTAASPATTASPTAVRYPAGSREWWLHLSRDDKLRVVEGELDGLVNGWWRAYTDYDTQVLLLLVKSSLKKSAWLAEDERLGKISEDQRRTEPRYSKNFHFYIDAIDHFYAAYPYATKATVGSILQCLSDKPWRSCAEVARMFSGSGH